METQMKSVSLIPPLQSEHVQRSLFPELHASAFDPVSSVWLSRTGHRMRALGLAPPQGRNLDLKERTLHFCLHLMMNPDPLKHDREHQPT
ncbi:hypothetical protein JOQ06_005860, partial [Pogonophryne albipinna]